MVVTESRAKKTKEEILTSRKEFPSALETLRRFAKLTGQRINEPSGIIRRSGRGQWLTEPRPRNCPIPYSSSFGHGKAK